MSAQFCDPNKSGIEHLLDFEFVEAIGCTYADAASFLIVGLLVYTAVASSIYIRTGSMIIPLGILMLGGGAIIGQMAGVASTYAVLLLLIFPAGIMAYVYLKFSR